MSLFIIYSTKSILYLAELKRKVSVVVIDGVCIGHPCCGVAHCKVPLKSNKDRFCPQHGFQSQICAVIGCTKPVAASGSKVCDLVKHQNAEKMHIIQGQSCFQLKERLKQAQLAHPSDSLPLQVVDLQTPISSLSEPVNDPDSLADVDPVDNNGEVVFELTPDGHTVPMATDSDLSSTTHRKLRIQFGRKCTHNEQLFVAPCGIIVAQETFYHSEAPSSVVVSLELEYYLGLH